MSDFCIITCVEQRAGDQSSHTKTIPHIPFFLFLLMASMCYIKRSFPAVVFIFTKTTNIPLIYLPCPCATAISTEQSTVVCLCSDVIEDGSFI